jgi:hypothetical protein
MGSGDHPDRRGARRFYDRRTPPRDPEQRQRWRAARSLLEKAGNGELVVLSCEVLAHGQINLNLTQEFAIRKFTDSADDMLVNWFHDKVADRSYEVEFRGGKMILEDFQFGGG